MDLEGCKAEIIGRSFPELKGLSIDVRYNLLSEAYLEFTRISRRKYVIEADIFLKGAGRSAIMGGIGHEIAHISRECSMGAICSFFDAVFYNNFSWYETWDERRTDLLVVQRGMGHELLEFLKYVEINGEEFTASDGLTVKELELLLRAS